MNRPVEKIKVVFVIIFGILGVLAFLLPNTVFSTDYHLNLQDRNNDTSQSGLEFDPDFMAADKVEIGKALFFDSRLSADQTVSCASCHDPANAFTDGNPVSIGVGGKKGVRNTPTLLNAAFGRIYFWDGSVNSLEEQALHPLTNSLEMGMADYDSVVARVAGVPKYKKSFKKVFKSDQITIE